MNLQTLEKIISLKPCIEKEFPFGDDVMVFKVKNKMFALISLKDNPLHINLKCDPDEAKVYREIYDCVIPGYHMNKKHWNTIILDDSMKKDILIEMIEDSYNLVVSKLTKKQKEELRLKNVR